MIRKVFICFVLCLIILQYGCSQENSRKGKTIAEINNYSLGLAEFESKLESELEMDDDYKMTDQGKIKFLNELIDKEILIQEAKKLKLDQQQNFIRAMEKYWESTLIRDLLVSKGEEIAADIKVSNEEIVTRYRLLLQTDEQMPPLEDIRTQLAEEIKEEKKIRLLSEWFSSLRKKSRIRINKELL